MAAQKSMLSEFAWDQRYRVSSLDDVLTPALLLYPEIVASNVERTLELLGGDANRWRVHIKTAKAWLHAPHAGRARHPQFQMRDHSRIASGLAAAARRCTSSLISGGRQCAAGQEIADQFPEVRISVLAENNQQVGRWRGSRVGVFLDMILAWIGRASSKVTATRLLNYVAQSATWGWSSAACIITTVNMAAWNSANGPRVAHAGYERLLKVVSEIERSGTGVPEVITAGTPTFPCSLAFEGFRRGGFIHRVSPGTVVYCDATSLAQLPNEYGYQPQCWS